MVRYLLRKESRFGEIEVCSIFKQVIRLIEVSEICRKSPDRFAGHIGHIAHPHQGFHQLLGDLRTARKTEHQHPG